MKPRYRVIIKTSGILFTKDGNPYFITESGGSCEFVENYIYRNNQIWFFTMDFKFQL